MERIVIIVVGRTNFIYRVKADKSVIQVGLKDGYKSLVGVFAFIYGMTDGKPFRIVRKVVQL